MEINQISASINNVKKSLNIIGNATPLINAIDRAMQVAPIDLSVLIIGESGSGKEFFPKIIHQNSARKHNKYIAVNCGAIPEGTIDSELFGHEKGAFTGAISSRKGYFEEANGGTIFLDEVAELPLTTQARLLRVLESGEYIRVGSSEVKKTNIRIVAATNKDMPAAVASGEFREDLYYRLSTILINVPPLRERGNDILLLTRFFTSNFEERYRINRPTYTDDAKQILLNYRWPGNVRELKNIIERMSLFEAGNTIDAEAVRKYLPQHSTEYKPTVASASTFNYGQEREFLFKMIFNMQQEIRELNGKLDNMSKAGETHITTPAHDIQHSPHSLIRYQNLDKDPLANIPYDEYSPITHETEEAVATPIQSSNENTTMTLEDTERETIRKSLERNGGKRRRTAEELNISERTLYRKIKEFGLE